MSVHVQILELYKEYIDPEFTWANFTVEEQAKVIVAPRSNNLLDTARVSQPVVAVAMGGVGAWPHRPPGCASGGRAVGACQGSGARDVLPG
jgi:hypothetical protein